MKVLGASLMFWTVSNSNATGPSILEGAFKEFRGLEAMFVDIEKICANLGILSKIECVL